MQDRPKRSFAALAAMQVASGGSAGFVEVCLMHPLDLIKTRFQIQGGPGDPHRYKSLADCFRTIYRSEGILSFYKGILPPILAETPKRAIKFVTFEQSKGALLLLSGTNTPTAMTFTLAGLCSGLIEGTFINPFEVVKVKLQAERGLVAEQLSTAATARQIIKADGFGLRGLNKGLTATLGRHGCFNMVYFSFYHNVKGLFPPAQDSGTDLLRRFIIGFFAGTFASTINIPFDVAKSRIQGPQPVPGQVKYSTCFASIQLIYKEEGFLALYKGLLPKVMRLGPGEVKCIVFSSSKISDHLLAVNVTLLMVSGGAIMLVVFDAVYERLQKWL